MKTTRFLKVSRTMSNDKCVPYIRLRGNWLKDAGFDIDTRIKVNIDYNMLTVKPEQNENSGDPLEKIVNDSEQNNLSKLSLDYKGYIVSLKMERNSAYKPVRLQSPTDTYKFLKPLQHESREILLSIMLNCQLFVVGVYEVSKGGIDTTCEYPFEIFKSAVISNSDSIILAHNHPSGISKPSEYDIRITKDIETKLNKIHISLIDHVIIGYNEFTSLKELGYLK